MAGCEGTDGTVYLAIYNLTEGQYIGGTINMCGVDYSIPFGGSKVVQYKAGVAKFYAPQVGGLTFDHWLDIYMKTIYSNPADIELPAGSSGFVIAFYKGETKPVIEIVKINLPDQLREGESVYGGVVVKNTGSLEELFFATFTRLDTGVTYETPERKTIQPGETYEFILPESLGWKMPNKDLSIKIQIFNSARNVVAEATH